MQGRREGAAGWNVTLLAQPLVALGIPDRPCENMQAQVVAEIHHPIEGQRCTATRERCVIRGPTGDVSVEPVDSDTIEIQQESHRPVLLRRSNCE